MIQVNWARLAARASVFSMGVWIVGGMPAHSQGRGGEPALSPKASAPIDLTGYWVSLVTEEWRYRMVAPPKGDYESVPLDQQGQKVADAWDPVKDKASGNQCNACDTRYGRTSGPWTTDRFVEAVNSLNQSRKR